MWIGRSFVGSHQRLQASTRRVDIFLRYHLTRCTARATNVHATENRRHNPCVLADTRGQPQNVDIIDIQQNILYHAM